MRTGRPATLAVISMLRTSFARSRSWPMWIAKYSILAPPAPGAAASHFTSSLGPLTGISMRTMLHVLDAAVSAWAAGSGRAASATPRLTYRRMSVIRLDQHFWPTVQGFLFPLSSFGSLVGVSGPGTTDH